MRSLLFAFTLVLVLAPDLARAVCAPPFDNPENDCDNDGVSILQGDCDDDAADTYPGASELCDGRDNDCDSSIDEGLFIDDDSDGVRACGTCGAPAACDCDDSDPAVKPGATEVCDAIDNDCDALVDERNAQGDKLQRGCYSGPGGTQGVGVCQGGTQTCDATTPGTESWGACVGEVTPANPPGAPEATCDNVDDDCDGVRDDGLIVDEDNDNVRACGSCGAPAAPDCDCNDDNPAIRPGATEQCDNIDRDCDGSVNDVPPRRCYDGPAGTYSGTCPGPNCNPYGQCTFGTQTCQVSGTWGACEGDVLPVGDPSASEGTCDGLDEDCDNVVDDGLVVDVDNDGARACGSCGAPNAPNCDCNDSNNQVRPGAAERCDAIDNDCDALVDERNNQGDKIQRRCYEGPPGTYTGTCPGGNCNPRGECEYGFQQCNASTPGVESYGACEGDVLPVGAPGDDENICDGRDNDCDGIVDDGLDNDGDGVNACDLCGYAPGCDCDDSDPDNYPGNNEVCDGQDNNCNMIVDEGFDDDGDGYLDCSACSASPCDCNDQDDTVHPGAPELCDCVDQNCNGQPWDGFDDDDGDGVPACAGPAAECNDSPPYGAQQRGAWCNVAARPETCDALDNDCDALVDERNNAGDPIRRSCYSGPAGTVGIGVCVGGQETCDATTPGTPSFTACIGEIVPSNPPGDGETQCNGADDDCDGTADDGFDLDGDGAVSCAECGNRPGCDCDDARDDVRPGLAEVCDPIDHDCDGTPNNVPERLCFEGSPLITEETYTGTCPGPDCEPKGACEAGTQSCLATGEWSACGGSLVVPVTVPSGDEGVCDGIDEDCDGVIDDGDFDADQDGYSVCFGDCDDSNPAVLPGALEICDGVDNDCDGVIDGVETSCYSGPDGTLDVGACVAGVSACMDGQPVGECVGEVVPTAEVCDGIDNDCDGQVDEDFDGDLDGFPDCGACPGFGPSECDCDDTDAFNRPLAVEVCDCQDNDCDAQVDEDGVCTGAPCHDFDADGFTNCAGDCDDSDTLIGPHRPELFGNGRDDDCDGAIDEDVDEDGDGYTTGDGDCDDRFAEIHPGAEEVCDGFDNNCDGRADEGFDQDGDFATSCAGDCDDSDPLRSPFRREVCANDIDDNCNGLIDEDSDADGDGVTICQGDCNDHSATAHPAAGDVPAAEEVCDGQDNDCDGQTDEGFDADGDRVATCFGDCDDTNADVRPDTYEIPGNGIDDNCDGRVDEGDIDGDGDGFSPNCGDCDDGNAAIHPHAEERCDRVDNNCDAYVDALPAEAELCAVCFDADADGFTNCDGDCDDREPTVFPSAPEICDLLDNDCDGRVDLDADGFSVCRDDEDAGPVDAGGDAGAPDEDAGPEDAGPVDAGVEKPAPPPVQIGCHCQGAGAETMILPGLALLLLGLGRASRRRLPRAALLVVTLTGALASGALLSACWDAIAIPGVAFDAGFADAGEGGEDAGPVVVPDSGPGPVPDSGVIDSGPPPCSTAGIVAHGIEQVPSSYLSVALPPGLDVTELAGLATLGLDEADAELFGFVSRREIPAGVDPTAPGALTEIADRTLADLESLVGAPAIAERTERARRAFTMPLGLAGVSLSYNLRFLAPTSAHAVRARVLATIARAEDVTGLPEAPADLPVSPEHVLSLLVGLQGPDVVVVGVVTRNARFAENQPRMNDLTNGTHLGPRGYTLSHVCEEKTLPELKSDFLWVIDNSGSMQEEQQALANAAGTFYGSLAATGLDFRLGVVTTDGEVLRGGGFVRELADFQNAVRVGIGGNGLEMGLEFGLRALRTARDHPDEVRRLREDAALVLIFFSDEESTNLMSVPAYAQAYRDEGAVAYAIVGPRPYGCQLVGLGVARPGLAYIEAATLTGGTTGSICNPNLAETIGDILVGAVGRASRSPLEGVPVSGSLAVKDPGGALVDRSRSLGFDYEPASNTVLFFGEIPPAGSRFQVAYAEWVPPGG